MTQMHMVVTDLLLPPHILNTETNTVYLKMLLIIMFGDADRENTKLAD